MKDHLNDTYDAGLYILIRTYGELLCQLGDQPVNHGRDIIPRKCHRLKQISWQTMQPQQHNTCCEISICETVFISKKTGRQSPVVGRVTRVDPTQGFGEMTPLQLQ